VAAPLLDRVAASLARDLRGGQGSSGAGGNLLAALNEARDRARADFARASREWSIAFDRSSMDGFAAALAGVVANAERQFHPAIPEGTRRVSWVQFLF
jgi:hypothetical protein